MRSVINWDEVPRDLLAQSFLHLPTEKAGLAGVTVFNGWALESRFGLVFVGVGFTKYNLGTICLIIADAGFVC